MAWARVNPDVAVLCPDSWRDSIYLVGGRNYLFHEQVTKYVDSIEVLEGFDHLCPEFWGDMLGDKGMGGLDLGEVRHGGGLQGAKL